MILELLLFLATIAVPAALASGGDDNKDSKEYEIHESYEAIRVYPSERRAVRYYDGGKEEYYY